MLDLGSECEGRQAEGKGRCIMPYSLSIPRSAIPLATARIPCLLGARCSGAYSSVRLDSSIDPSAYGAMIYIDGAIDEGMHDAIVRIVSAVPGRRIMIRLNSTGGSTQAGFEIIDYLSQLNRDGYTITTYVEKECNSMCIPIY
ncbi:MAG: ATP-dependent Clp protease proteolytic subunit, partial [Acidobacteriota bacterium]